ncbi:MAG: GCN5 family acetyltransferase [Cycloclasticus sp. Phe_18]|jgi:acetyltransferase|nr:MAG: GCN5 family acetyltransferase [Cycloclasticus sp. Phe_18]
MSNNTISNFFSPQTVTVIGASPREGSLGLIILKNLLEGGLVTDKLTAVNPKYKTILSTPCYKSITDLPDVPDLAVIVSPAKTVPALIHQLGQKGTQCVVVISAGFSEGESAHGKKLEEEMQTAARDYGLRIIGPNCLGILSPINGLNASFSHLMPKKGKIGVISQSGAMLTSIIDWACGRGIGFSHLISLGDMNDIGFAEMLDFMSADPDTNAILIYMESVHQARRFISAARGAARTKPIIVLKVGRSDEGRQAAASHTGALAGSDEVYDAAFNRSGLLRVDVMSELFYAAASLTAIKPVRGERLAIVTNGGGMGVLATDSLIHNGGKLAKLSPDTLAILNTKLPPTWSHGNPIDIIGDAGPERYTDAIKALENDKGIDAVLVLNCPTAVASSLDAAQVVADIAQNSNKCLLTSWAGCATAEKSRALFAKQHIPTYATPEAAVNSFMHLVRYKRNQDNLMETPPALAADLTFDSDKAWGVVAKVLSEGREWLNELEAKAVLQAYGIPTVESQLAKSPEEAAAIAEKMGFPIVIKLFSSDILHKSDVHGVALDLQSSEAVQQAAVDIEKTTRNIRPDAKIEGFTVQRMVNAKGAHELILGVLNDDTFGPVLLFGQGGTAVEILNDKALALPPLNLKLAKDMIARTKVYQLLKGYRDQDPINMDALQLTLIKLSQMVIDLDHLAELDINPLLADKNGVIALDARIKVSLSKVSGAKLLAIPPYPQKYEELVRLSSGKTFQIRPIKPEDEPALIKNFELLTKEEIRFRFFHAIKEMNHSMAARFTQIDYDREMAFVATDPNGTPDWKLHAVARLIIDSSGDYAEFALVVNHLVSGQGLGTLLMYRLISYAKKQGLKGLYGDVLKENEVMISICKKVGFTVQTKTEDPNIITCELRLT